MASTRVRIAIDAMGGDHAPAEIVAGALRAQDDACLGVSLCQEKLKSHASQW